VPVVLHHHHFYPRWAELEAAILRRADAVITVSKHSRAELIAAGVTEDRIRVVYQGIERPARTTGWPEAWPAAGLRLLQLGRLEARKRPWIAIDALARLRRSGARASLVIAGEGSLANDLVARARKLGVEDAVRLLHRVSDAHKWRLYDSADALLFGSTLEGFGLVVAEAQSRGVPVVAAQGTATAEALDPNRSGFLAPPDGEAFAICLRQLTDDRRRLAMANHAVHFARRFDWDTCASSMAEVYRSIVEDVSSEGARTMSQAAMKHLHFGLRDRDH
jgi:glycosyltransferase involved in cell wall biosynthesis